MTVLAPHAARFLWLRVRSLAAFVILALGFITSLPATAHAQLGMTEVEGLRLVYIDGTESYLVPHAARTFLNSLAFHKRLFGFTPSEDITVLLARLLEDSGNAPRPSVPATP